MSDTAKNKLDTWLASQSEKSLLRFLTCGSVDDGKSTLIGRLLYDSQLILDDQLATLRKESVNRITSEEGLDFSLLVDGLAAEREQGITIDVAYRFFATENRNFIVADTPGHEQYTRNMVTGASNADLAIVLIDARKGILTQTRRHTFILSLLGVRHVVAVVNKIDLVEEGETTFKQIEQEYHAFADPLDFDTLQIIPISALRGDNITGPSEKTAWYKGPQLVPYLEQIDISHDQSDQPFRFPVQWVNRANRDFRGFSGTVSSGKISVGDDILVAASRKKTSVSSIVTLNGQQDTAIAGDAVTLTLADEIDISRGDVLSLPGKVPDYSNQFQADLVWMHEDAMAPGRSYLLKLATQEVPATLTTLKHKININTLEQGAATVLELNEVGTVNLATDRPIAFDTYADNHRLGGFILIDRISNATVAAGMIQHGLRRGENITYQDFDVTRQTRAIQKGQEPTIIWFTGLSGSGKSTVANIVEKQLTALGRHVYILDGDNVRHGLNKDLGFTDEARVENIRRVSEVARLLADAGLIVLVSFISPFQREREIAREIAGDIKFIEAYVDTSLETCEARDPKGLYAKARAGEIKNFTGLDSPFEPPSEPDLILTGDTSSPEEMAEKLIAKIQP